LTDDKNAELTLKKTEKQSGVLGCLDIDVAMPTVTILKAERRSEPNF
jgi:hypothetical protein